MPIPDCWDFNYAAKVISHIDGVLSYDTGAGAQADVGDYVYGATSGAVGKVLSRTGDTTSGTLSLTNVVGQFEDTELLEVLSELPFDAVTNGGFKVSDTIVDQTAGSIDVKAIEYNIDGTAGHGTMYGTNFTAFVNNEQLDISGGQTDVADADTTGTDNDTKLTTTLVNGTLAVPGTANTNNSVIVHYDAGTIAIPDDAHISDASTGAEGYAQKVVGSTVTGSVRVVDSDTTGGAWTDNNALRIEDVEYYDTLVAGKVFSAGDVLKGASSGYEARVLAVIDDGDDSGKLILGGNTGTPWTDGEAIQVRQPDDSYVTYANVETGQDSYLDPAIINIPDGVRSVQRADQGGIFPTGSLNIVRSANAFYTYAQELFVQLGQLDDDPALEGNVRDQLYTILNQYVIPDLSFRFLEKGAFQDSAKNNIFTNYQSDGVVADIGDHGYFYSSSKPTPQPDIYLEQDGERKSSSWLEGHVDVLVKVKTSTDPKYINPSVEALGQLIDGAKATWHLRPYLRTYDTAEVTKLGGQAPVFLSNANDLNNNNAQYQAAFTGGSGQLLVGEEITTSDGKRGVIVTADAPAAGNITYVLKSDTNLADSDGITGVVSGATATISGAPTNLVAGYGTDIRQMSVMLKAVSTPAAGITGTFVLGELCTQDSTGATGYFMEADSNELYLEKANAIAFSGDNNIVGGVSGATWNPGVTTQTYDAQALVPKDIGGGVGDKNYKGVVSANITDGSPQTVLKIYEWWKFLTRRESTYQVKQPGQTAPSVYWEGRLYRRLDASYAEVRGASPFGVKAGSLVIGAQGNFIEKSTLDSGDIRNIQLIDNLGDTYDPPNLQSLVVGNLFNGVAVAVYRSTGAGSEVILRTEFKVGTLDPNNRAGDNTILVAAQGRGVSPLPQDVPETGVLRVLDPNDTGNYLSFPYSAVDRTTNIFTLASGTIGDVTGAQDLVLDDNAHVVPIEKQASGTSVNNTLQYVADINLYAVARVKGKQPFKAAAVFGSAGLTIGAVLNPDNVVNLP